MQHSGHFIIAAGVPKDSSLPKVKDDLEEVVRYFSEKLGYEHALAELMDSPDAPQFRRRLSDWFAAPERRPDDRIVLYFSGHGEVDIGQEQHYLMLAESDPNRLAGTAFPTVTLATIPFEAGRVKQLLVVLDTCYSGAGVAEAAARASAAWVSNAKLDEGLLLLLISCARRIDRARDGAFASEFVKAIRNVTGALGRQVQEYLAVGSIVEELKGKLPEFQQATWQFAPPQTGDVLSPIRNPLSADVPPGLDLEDQEFYRRDRVTHFVPRAEGGEVLAPDSNIWYFSGRHRALAKISAWLKGSAPATRLVVVTGRPGAGKSALIGRLVTLADPRYRARILSLSSLPEETIPPAKAFDTAVHLRHRKIREVADILTAALGIELLDPRLREEDLGTALAQALASAKRPVCLAFDALDEAAQAQNMWREFLRPLCGVSNVRILIGSRPLFHWGTADEIDLSESTYLGETDVQDYIERRLLAAEEHDRWTPYRNQPLLAKKVAQAGAARAEGVFLVAHIVSRLLIEASAPIDTTAEEWEKQIPSSARVAFEHYLAQFGELNDKVRDVFLPLAFAEGQGLPFESIWVPLASALSGKAYVIADIEQVLKTAGSFVIEDKESGRSVYRLYHMELADYFCDANHNRAAAIQDRFVEVLLSSVPRDPNGLPDYPRAHPYVLSHVAEHAAKAGRLEELIPDAGLLASIEPAGLLPCLWRIQEDPARQWRDCYQIASHLLPEIPWTERASTLERVARQQALPDIGNEFAALGGMRRWRIPWSVWRRATPHRTRAGTKELCMQWRRLSAVAGT